MTKFEEKLDHLKGKFRMKEEEKLSQVPDGLERFSGLNIFDRTQFDLIEEEKYDVEVIGEVTLSDKERAVLCLHPKFSGISAL